MSPWPLTRRAFLGRSLALSTALAGAGAVLPSCRGRSHQDELPAGVRLQVLSAWEFAVLRAAAARLLEGAGEGPTPAEVVQRADATLAEVADPAVRGGVHQVLLVLEYGTPLRGYVRPFSALGARDQDRVLAGLAASRFTIARVSFAAVKLLAMFYFYTDPRTWPALGYQGPWVGRIPLPAYAVDYGLRNDVPFTSGKGPYPEEPS